MNISSFFHIKHLLLLPLLCLFLQSCVKPEEVLYLQDAHGNTSERIKKNYEIVIQKDDQLYIAVSSKEPELTTPFISSEMGSSIASSNNNYNRPKGYLVDSKGDVILPVIGKIHAAGKTCTELATDISAALKNSDYIKDASVNVQIMNFKFSVLGEVQKPGTYEIQGERITIMEAISKAGDLNIDGNRDITVIRERNGVRDVAKVDLRSKDLFKSPYYYLQQNDTVYVSPSDRKINTRSESLQLYSYSLSGLSLLIAIIAVSV